MSYEQVWHRFEAKRKDGIVLKLRIQDLPPTRINNAIDMFINIFGKDEALHRASGMATATTGEEKYREIWKHDLTNPSVTTVICCSDDTPDVKKIIGINIGKLVSQSTTSSEEAALQTQSVLVRNEEASQERKKLAELFNACVTAYDPIKELNLNAYFECKAFVVDPDYRGLGIAEHFFKVREKCVVAAGSAISELYADGVTGNCWYSRLMCKALGMPLAGGWMTGFGTQIAAHRDGWKTVKELDYEYLAKKYDVTFTDVPSTIKYMIARIDDSDSTDDQRDTNVLKNFRCGKILKSKL